MVKVLCSECNEMGLLQKVGNNYYRIRHYDGYDPTTNKPKLHYHQIAKDYALSKLELLKGTKALENTIFDQGIDHQMVKDPKTQAILDLDRLKSSLKYGLNQSGRRLVGLGLKPSKLAIPGSNPGDRTSFSLDPRIVALTNVLSRENLDSLFSSLSELCTAARALKIFYIRFPENFSSAVETNAGFAS